jgi:FMN phosphatase YigB (HAD superfamily)
VTIVFDMDNTLVDEFGAAVRPGMAALLARLRRDGHRLVLWTNSRRERAVEILRLHGLRPNFVKCLYREDYDPQERGLPKDIRAVGGSLLVDDDPDLCAFVRGNGGQAVQVSPYRKGGAANLDEVRDLYRAIAAVARHAR